MSVLKFRPRDRRQGDPFRATPITHVAEPACKACSHLDYGPCECPRDCGWPSCMGERARAAAEALAAQVAAETEVMQAQTAAACTCGAGAPFGAGRLSPLTATVEADLGGCLQFRDAVQAHFVRHEHTQGAAPGDGEGWLAEAARIYDERFTGELAAIAERASTEPVPAFAGELQALHGEKAADTDDDIGPEFDQVAERYEAGFYQARRVFHRADTAGFPAVTP